MAFVHLSFFCAFVIGAAVSDLLTMRIPNWISLSLVAGFTVFFSVSGAPLSALWPFLLGGASVFAVCFIMFALGWIGGGDAKLLSSMALWFGWTEALIAFLFFTSIAGLALTVILLLLRRLPVLPLSLYKIEWLARLHYKETGVPYGIAIAAGGLFAVAQGWFPFSAV